MGAKEGQSFAYHRIVGLSKTRYKPQFNVYPFQVRYKFSGFVFHASVCNHLV